MSGPPLARTSSHRCGRASSSGRIALLIGVMLLMTAGRVANGAASLDFDKTFDRSERDGQTYYEATYLVDGQSHRLQVWRDRNIRIKRRTDDAVEVYLDRPRGEVEWTMSVLDLKQKIRTDVSRTNLMRVGHVTDWFAQGHSLNRPSGPYRLASMDSRVPGVAPIAACRWYLLSQEERASKICWSKRQRVPVVITDEHDRIVWRLTSVGTGPLPADLFEVPSAGYVLNDANEDIHSD